MDQGEVIEDTVVQIRDVEAKEREEKEKVNRHNLTVKGEADNTGIIATNASHTEEKLRSEKKEKTLDYELRLLLNLLDEHIKVLEQEIKDVKVRIQALERLQELLQTEKLNLSNPDHILLLQQAEIKADQANTETVNERINHERIELYRLEQNLEEAKKLRHETQTNPHSQSLAAAIRQLESTNQGQVQSDILANKVDSRLATEMDEALDFSPEEMALLTAARAGKDKVGNNDKVSFASTLDETPITTVSLKQVFESAQGTDTTNHIPSPTPSLDPTGGFKGIPKTWN
ncbi:hypothetical protein BFP97_16475 [Roseivirga sp. 4D4]|uniref:hypothetical protein n=1 Tax=Roseivirga sp. 4D4 TaxID=1889784 RepID=UPI0008533851|nr:hypothetical protein [Roseivirga sp. 4D4]OEK03020.1 hypothetical protein BFP97_16475 [Roseivirga sp. 4D4]